MILAQVFAHFAAPVFIAIVGQQVARIKGQGGLVSRLVLSVKSRVGGSFEFFNVDQHRQIGAQAEDCLVKV